MSKQRLKVFGSGQDARRRASAASVKRRVETPISERGYYLKQVGADSVEPTFLCEDGRWRRYDLVADFDLDE